MFDANNNPGRSYVRPIRLSVCVQVGSKITLIIYQPENKHIQKIQVICYKAYSQEYFRLESAEK